MTFTQRKQLHRAIAEWYEKNYQEDLSPYYSRLAHHWLKGEVTEKAIYYLDRAGEQALDLYSNQDVMHFISAAIELDQQRQGRVKSTNNERPEENLQQARWERMLGTAYFRIGKLPDAQRHFVSALKSLGRPMPETNSAVTLNLLKELLLQVSHRFSSQDQKKHSVKDRAVKEELARIEIESVFYYAQNIALLAWGMLRRLNLAEQVGMPSLMAEGYSNLQFIAGFAGLKRVGRLYQRLTWEAVEKGNRTSTRIFALLREAVTFYINCEWERAVDEFETGIRLADELRDTRQLEELTASLASCLLLQGKFEQSYKIWKDYYERAVRKEGPQTQAWTLYGQGYNLTMLGQVEDGIRNLKASLEIPMMGESDKILNASRNSALCLAYLRNGQSAEALDHVAQHYQITPAVPALSSVINEHSAVLDAIFGLMENHLSGRHRLENPELEQLMHSFRRVPKTVKALRKLPVNAAGSWLYEGMYNHLDGKPKKAFAGWKKCLEIAERNRQPYELGRAHYEMGRRLDANDPSRTGHLSQAIEIFETLNTPYELNLAKTALEEM